MCSTEPTSGPMAPVANYSMVEKVVMPSRRRRKMAKYLKVETNRLFMYGQTQDGSRFYFDRAHRIRKNEPAGDVGQLGTPKAEGYFCIRLRMSVFGGGMLPTPGEEGPPAEWGLEALAHFVISPKRDHLATILQVIPEATYHRGADPEAQELALKALRRARRALRHEVEPL